MRRAPSRLVADSNGKRWNWPSAAAAGAAAGVALQARPVADHGEALAVRTCVSGIALSTGLGNLDAEAGSSLPFFGPLLTAITLGGRGARLGLGAVFELDCGALSLRLGDNGRAGGRCGRRAAPFRRAACSGPAPFGADRHIHRARPADRPGGAAGLPARRRWGRLKPCGQPARETAGADPCPLNFPSSPSTASS